MRILVLQTTRMGDVIQTSPLVRVLRLRYPDACITAMVREMGRLVAERNPDVDEVWVYDEDGIYQDLRSEDSDRLLSAYRQVEALANRIREACFDLVFNCTQSVESAMLLKIAGVSRVVGAHLSDDREFVLRGPWTNYLFTSVFHREYSDINLCDVFRNLAEDAPSAPGLVFDVRDDDRRSAAELLASKGVPDDATVICMQLGASEDAKRWPEYRFAELAQRIHAERAAAVVLVGVESESSLGGRFAACSPGPFVALFGETGLPRLAAVLERARCLVTNDTGTMHLAAAVRCPVVLVSVGPVHFRETGPYGEGHVAIERRRDSIGSGEFAAAEAANRDRISAEQVLLAVDMVTGRLAPPLRDDDSLRSVAMYRSAFASDGFLQWRPLIERDLTPSDVLRVAYRAMWLAHLNGRPGSSALAEVVRTQLSGYREVSGEPAVAVCRVIGEMENALEAICGLADQGLAWTADLVAVLRSGRGYDEAKRISSQLVGLDDRIRIHGQVYVALAPLTAIARYERDNLEGSDACALAVSTAGIYGRLEQRARLLRQALDEVRAAAEGR